MSNYAIQVEGLSKKYRIGVRHQHQDMLRDALVALAKSPFKVMRRREPLPQRESGNFWALRDISFDVGHGEVLGVIGPNGAGKSTLLKILSQITEPTRGRIEVRGRIGSLLEVGTGFHPELTGRENVYLSGAILGMRKSEIDRRFEEIVEFSGIEPFLDTPIKRYSSGMQVRLGFAVAAHLETEILLVDEVLAVGDINFQKKCVGKMNAAADEGRTILFVSHNLGAINALCNRAICLIEGRIHFSGCTEQVVGAYMTEMFQKETQSIERLRLLGYGTEIRFREITLESGDEGAHGFSEPLQYRCLVESEIDAHGLSIGSSIFDSNGTCVGTLISRDTFSISAGKTRRLHLRIPNTQLAPGSYYAGLSIGRGGYTSRREDFDIVIGRPTFQILPIGPLDTPVANWHPNWGHIVFTEAELTFGE